MLARGGAAFAYEEHPGGLARREVVVLFSAHVSSVSYGLTLVRRSCPFPSYLLVSSIVIQ